MIARTRRFAIASLAATLATVPVTRLAGQQLAEPQAAAAVAQQQPSAGPTVDRAAVGARTVARTPATTDDAEAAMQQRLGLGQARALMIVGFAAVVIGLLMDNDPGTLIAVGGAVVGLYGLYHYLR